MKDKYDYETIQSIITRGINSQNHDTALKAAQAAILDQMRITLHKIYLHGIPVDKQDA